MRSNMMAWALAPRRFTGLFLILAMFGPTVVAAEEPLGGPPPLAFSSQTITSRVLPTQLEFGPDGRLYVAELDGLVYAFTIDRNDQTGNYSVAATEVIDLIQTLANHNDDGTSYSSNLRSVTGMITAGTASNPVLYVTSSDPRFDDPLADTNSGVLSRLTWSGSEWTKLDLVRSLPRSAHDHFPNGMALDAASGILYLAQGGHTNMGAPSFSFGYLPEYALSASVLSIDLNAIGEQTYDIPTLKGEVFGGHFGDNQAMMVPGGPVQVHSPGYRNIYDVLLTTSGQLYTFDNDSNAGWGGLVIGEGTGGACTNQSNESDSATHNDNFHLITGPGYYGGHPNPTRANRANTFDGLSPIPAGLENPVECEFLIPGVEDGAIALNNASSNGLAEYTATNFGGQMAGNIIVTAWDGKVLRLSLNSSGDQVTEKNDLFTSLSGPLGITAQGDADPFPGTIWVGQFFNGNITVFEPDDFFECDVATLDPNDTSPNGYTYGDLIDNGLDPCNPAQVPPDFDQDLVSDLNDPDIDGDGIANEHDRFDFDAANGRGNPLPHRLAWISETVGTLGGMSAYNAPGFSGLMAHPTSPVSVFEQFNPDRLIPGGATGIFTLEEVTPGDARLNTQENALHLGVDVHGGSPKFTAQTQIVAPFAGGAPQGHQSMGLFIGKGDQDNYIKLVTNASGGDGGVKFAREIQGDFESQQVAAAIAGVDSVDLFLVVDPAASTVEASYVITMNGVQGARTRVGEPITLPSSWLNDTTNGPAIGIISTSRGADPFPASWGFIDVYEGAGEGFPDPVSSLLADPAQVDFGGIVAGSTSDPEWISLTNTGEVTVAIGNLAISGEQADDFGLVAAADGCSGVELAVGQACSFSVQFHPSRTGGRTAQVDIPSNAEDLAVELQGQGVIALDLQIGAAPIPAIAGDPLSYTLVVNNLADAQAENVTLAISSPSNSALIATVGCEQDPVGQPTCTVGPIPANGSSEIVVTVEVSGSAVESLQFAASVSADSLLGAVTGELTTPVAEAAGEWHTINTEFGESRHEGASVQAGDAFYVMGGRESDAVRIYDPLDGSDGRWTSGATSPIQLHHFQAVELDGLIYAIGAMTGPYPYEPPVENVYIYDPLADRWITGPAMPSDRLRGSSGTVVHDGLIYWISGNTNGHVGPVTAMVDVYDPAMGSFTALAEIPHPRDHFFATLHEDSIYVIGGRRSVPEAGAFEPTIAEIDVYDIAGDVWQTLPASVNLNPPRAAAATDRIGEEIIIAGGESGSEEPMAHVEAQAFNPATGQWRNLADMLTPRHAAQAIVSNGGFYLAAGSPYRGGPGGAVLNTEALFLAGVTTPTGIPITAGTISAPASIMFDSASGVVPISHAGGNQAVVIRDIHISGSTGFTLAEPLPGAVSLAPGGSREIRVNYLSETGAASAVLEITDSNNQVTAITLVAEGRAGPIFHDRFEALR